MEGMLTGWVVWEVLLFRIFQLGYQSNYSYFPILVRWRLNSRRDELHDTLLANGIQARRYFFPLLSDLELYASLPSSVAGNLPNARRIASQVLCLPMHTNLQAEDVDLICAKLHRFTDVV